MPPTAQTYKIDFIMSKLLTTQVRLQEIYCSRLISQIAHHRIFEESLDISIKRIDGVVRWLWICH